MSENLHNIDDLFRNALNDHEEEPSPGIWDNLDNQLDKKKIVHIHRKYNALKWIAASLLIFSFAAGMYAIHTRMKNRELVKASKKASTTEIRNDRKSNAATNKSLEQNRETQDNKTVDTTPKASISKSGNDDIGANKKLSTVKEVDIRGGEKQSLAATKTTEKTNEGSNKSSTKHVNLRYGNTAAILASANNKTPDVNKKIVSSKAERSNTARKQPGTSETENEASVFDENSIALKPVPGIETIQSNRSNLLPLPDLSAGIINRKEALLTTVLSSTENVKPVDNTSLTKSVRAPNKIRNSKVTPFSISAFFSRDFILPNLQDDQPHFREDDRNEIKEKEKSGFSSTYGLLLNYNFNKNWTVQSGLTVLNRVTEIEPKTIFARPDPRGNVQYRFSCSAGYGYLTSKGGTTPASGDSITALPSKNTLKYIGVPLNIKYNLVHGNFNFSPGVGVAANFLSNSAIETGIATGGNKQQEVIKDITGLKSSFYSGVISLDMGYAISNRFSVNFIPAAKFGLTSINKNAPVKSYFNSINLAAGITINL
jgi:hypothetical protein